MLDEVSAIKKARSITFRAVEDLRQHADMCLMLTGSPLDNTWLDVFAYIQLLTGHQIRTNSVIEDLFADLTQSGRISAPKGRLFLRLIQMLNAFVIRRPETTVGLPTLHERSVRFELSEE